MRKYAVALLVGASLLSSTPAFATKGDTNCDGAIGAADILAIVSRLGGPPGDCTQADVNGDADVDSSDLSEELDIVFPPFEEFIAQEVDFECLTNWALVRHFRIANTLGHLDDALAVAHGDAPFPYPPGTIIQLIPNEAMVKRGGNYDLGNANWEYFIIDPRSGETKVTQRGRNEVANGNAIPCFACHSAARPVDFICESGNGCIELGLTEELILAIQERDPRCGP
jgi:Dockerin type I domain